jgi:hypothetical protein
MPRLSRHFSFLESAFGSDTVPTSSLHSISRIAIQAIIRPTKERLMKKWLIRIVIVFVVLIAALFIAGALLPEEHHASKTLITKQSPQALWDAINDHATEAQWRADVANVTSLGEREGKPVWRENYKDGNSVTLITTESKPPTRMVRELTDLDGPFSGRWEIDIAPTPAGSNITVTEIGKVSNPLFRFVSKFIIGHTTFMERYLKGLAGKFGEQPQFAN